jgi:hypothetical protein
MFERGWGTNMRMLMTMLGVAVLAGCSSTPDHEIARTITLTPDRLADIRANPWVNRYRRGSGPSARLAGLDGDPWPGGVLFLEYGPYLEELGFEPGHMLAEVNGKPAHELFEGRWQDTPIQRPGGFHAEHYEDLMRHLFVENDPDGLVLTIYTNVPRSSSKLVDYEPVVEHWQLELVEPE